MPTPQPQILLCTVGTSLFFPNLAGLLRQAEEGKLADDLRPLADAYRARDAAALAAAMAARDPSERLLGAEANSIQSLIANRHVPANAGVYFFHSATDDGRLIAEALAELYRRRGHAPVEAVEVAELQDQDPKRFRTKGLRNLAKRLCEKIRAHSATACAINATGGYKAQIAVAVLLGQALGVPVYYMHERFSEIIAFPPMPVALDFECWMRASGLLAALEGDANPAPRALFDGEWDEKFESLVEPVEIDGKEYLELSATGQIFHETFRQRFRTHADEVLPPAAPPGRKRPPEFASKEAHLLARRDELARFMQRVTDEVPQVVGCATNYFNPDLPQRTRFIETRGQVEGVYSDGTFTARFRVETTATTDGQRAAVVAALNEWLANRR